MLWYHDPGSTLGLMLGGDTQQEMCRMDQNIRYVCARVDVPNQLHQQITTKHEKKQRNMTNNDETREKTTKHDK